MSKSFSLNQNDVIWAWHGSRVGSRGNLPRASAVVDTSSWRLSLKHEPTDVEVQGEIPMGHYSNKKMKIKKDKLWEELQEQLRLAVAKHLLLPGR